MSTPRRRKPAARRAPRRKPAANRDFWGTESHDDAGGTVIRPATHPTALVRSLGPPPLPGGGVLPQHYFDAVYERAAALAVALAASAGLSETEESAGQSESTEPD